MSTTPTGSEPTCSCACSPITSNGTCGGGLAPLLFEDDDRQQARAKRTSPVQPARISDRAKAKADTKTTAEGFPVHSLKTLLADLATLTLNQVTLPTNPDQGFPMIAQPTPLQRKAFELLDVDPTKIVPSTMPV